jgi:hypothetical protein
MRPLRNKLVLVRLLTVALVVVLATSAHSQSESKPAPDASISKAVGTIKSVQPDSITVAAESGGEVTATLSPATKIQQVPPGEKDLKNATTIQAKDLQAGDRVLVRGRAPADAQPGGSPAGTSPVVSSRTIAALSVIVMKQADLSAKQQRERDDWQKRGVGGLVTKVDPASATISISSSGLGANKSIAIHVNKDAILRRYASGSVKFDDAKPAPLDQIKVGDQLRARGTRSPDGSELTAQEIVSGTFRNIAGTITAIDAANNTMTINDLIAKGSVVVKVSSDSQMKKLPAEMAQRVAMRLKGEAATAGDHSSGDRPSGDHSASPNAPSPSASAQGSEAKNSGAQGDHRPGSQAGGASSSAPADLQRLLARLPNSTLADLQKGEAVMIVASQSSASPAADSGTVTAITLLAGVEPILTAAPSRAATTLLSPWSLNASGGEGEAAQ